MSNKSYHINQAALLMRSQHTAVLSTHSVSMHGYPFGSVMPFLMTEEGNVVVYASDIAQHSRNIKNTTKSVYVFMMANKVIAKQARASPF
jgi:putative heme iron utilization protein